ncbi:MAG: endolytic transglycosylase MltG [Armatimonadetes bacterium]|nr:endolytic transglycosylase MltG [Armatimonadota bacterium]
MANEETGETRRGCGRRVLAALAVLALSVGVGLGAVWSLMPASRQKKAVVVEIPRNWGSREIAGRLRAVGLIRSEWAFLAAGRVLGELGNLQAGEYELDVSMSPVEILDKLARGDVKAYWVTIPEGSTIDDIAHLLERQRMVNPTRFATLAKRGGLRLGPEYGVARRHLEGYLFPDTYKIPRGISEERLLRVLLAGFRREVLQGMDAEIETRTNGLSVADSITLASLVEREARLPDERARVAGVLLNRLRRGMRLECDATVQYALGKTKPRLLLEDLEIDSPYNTYKRAGLPPGPICSPGRAALRAALKPERHGYLFYVADGKTGGHLFSRSFAEHQAAIRRVRGSR